MDRKDERVATLITFHNNYYLRVSFLFHNSLEGREKNEDGVFCAQILSLHPLIPLLSGKTNILFCLFIDWILLWLLPPFSIVKAGLSIYIKLGAHNALTYNDITTTSMTICSMNNAVVGAEKGKGRGGGTPIFRTPTPFIPFFLSFSLPFRPSIIIPLAHLFSLLSSFSILPIYNLLIIELS